MQSGQPTWPSVSYNLMIPNEINPGLSAKGGVDPAVL
jgi:hypothetical protein